MTLFYLGIFAASVLASFVLTRYIRNLAMARGWVAGPGLERHLHKRPLAASGRCRDLPDVSVQHWHCTDWSAGGIPRLNFGFSFKRGTHHPLPGSLIFLLGLYDDLHPVGPYFKFLVQVLAGVMSVCGRTCAFSTFRSLFSGYHFSWFVGLAAHDSVGSRHHQRLQPD